MLVWWTRPLCIDCCIPKVLISKDYAWTITCHCTILKYPYPKQWYCTPWVCYNFWFFWGLLYVHCGVPLVWITPSIPSISASSFWTPWAFRRYQTSSDPLQPCRAAHLWSKVVKSLTSIWTITLNCSQLCRLFYSMNTSTSCKGNNGRLTVG